MIRDDVIQTLADAWGISDQHLTLAVEQCDSIHDRVERLPQDVDEMNLRHLQIDVELWLLGELDQ